jgi:hypothetical protein
MIDKSSFEKAVGVADIFASEGFQVLPVAGTPLAHLVSQTNLIGELPPHSTSADFLAEDSLALAVTSDNDPHNSTFDDYVSTLANAVTFQVNVARTIISPIIQDAVDKITEVTRNSPVSDYAFEIVTKSLPKPLLNESLIGEIQKNMKPTTLAPRGTITLAGSSFDEVVGYLMSGSELFDNSVKDWLVSMGEVWIKEVWDNVFCSINLTSISSRPELMDYLKSEDSADKALFVYLVVRKLMLSDVPETVTVSLTAWRETIRDYITISANALCRDYSAYKESVSSKKLVKSFNNVKKIIYVYEDSYLQYLNGGGKNEIIFGAILENKIPYFQYVLDENVERYQKAWDSYANINKEAVRLKTFNFFRTTLENVLIGQLSSLTDFEQEKSSNSNFVPFLARQYKLAIGGLSTECMNDIYHTVMKLVCECRFPYSNAYTLLDTINDFCKENPQTDVREAALIATIEVICDHMTDQMVFVK